MSSEMFPGPETRPGLPPVEPPSGRLIGQLFLVPGLIVAGVVVILLFFNWLVSGPRSTESYLRRLDDANPEVRWRAAADLAQVLLRDNRLASDAPFALALTVRLDRARDAVGREEASAGRLSPEELAKEKGKREQEQNYAGFLAACLGNFVVPTGAPLLQELAVDENGTTSKVVGERRRRALWALANLGENLKRFDKLAPAQQEAVIAALSAPNSGPRQSAWAEAARRELQARMKGTPDAMGMERTIEICARAADPFLRELDAFAANFWKGDPAAEARIEKALVLLAHDDGHGAEVLEEWSKEEAAKDEAGQVRSVVKNPGLKVRMNAAIALARRGSDKIRPEVLAEMLDEAALRKEFLLREPTGQEQPDEAAVLNTIDMTLQAVAELHRQRPGLAMPAVRSAVAKLTSNENVGVRSEATKTQQLLEK